MQKIAVTENLFEGQVSFEKEDDCLNPWRLPYERRALFPSVNENLLRCANMPSGVRLRFNTDSKNIKLVCEVIGITEDRECFFDLTVDGELVLSYDWREGVSEYVFDCQKEGEKIVEIWLSMNHNIKVKGIEIDDGASLSAIEDKRPKWITYGSSITHCRDAYSPARTWPATVARKMDLNLTSLGFNGQCQIDGMIGQVIGELPADFISLKLGINVYGNSSLGPRTFRSNIISLIYIIRQKHPNVPMAVISPIYSFARETEECKTGLTLQMMREEVEDAVRRIKDTCEDKNIYYFSGLELLGEDKADLLFDRLHPGGEGYELMGNNFIEKVYKKIDFNK